MLVSQTLGKLASRYPFVQYLGPLSDAELRTEASTWCCFVHPMFVYAKGCSTKIGVALGWGLPVATTHLGVRGYVWDAEITPPSRRAPLELARLSMELMSNGPLPDFQRRTGDLCNLSPTIDTVGAQIRSFVLNQ